MAWRVEYDPEAVKALKQMDKPVATRIMDYLDEMAASNDPRARAKPHQGPLRGLRRYRVGDDRIVCGVIDGDFTIIALDLGHRSKIYL
ncbi:type II toxin-antitoxin system RelE family toxin [Paeniglutamicibacter antarcticus]|uniref:Type II toxin-antitoxin system RelE/ParE family toxin n=1 Tax=Paeniglutamicibacter antarcticus TaxID=494023 RepID=A0ABP9TUS1_9MICC